MNNIYDLLSSILITILTAFATGIITSWVYWRNKKAELEQEYLKRFNEEKWEVYTEFTKLLYNLLLDETVDFPGWGQLPAEVVIASQLILIGSDDVVRAFRDWRETSMVYGKSQVETKQKLFLLIAIMRNDLGVKYSKLEVEDLLGALEPKFSKT